MMCTYHEILFSLNTEGLGGEGDDRGWDGWMASLTRWTWVWWWSWWWTGRPGVLWFMGSQRVGHDWVTELNWTEWGRKVWAAATWMDLEHIMLSEMTVTKGQILWIPLPWGSWSSRIIEIESRMMVAGGEGRRMWGVFDECAILIFKTQRVWRLGAQQGDWA